MAPIPKTPAALAIAAYKLWRRLPPDQRRQVLDAARKHGPKIKAGAASIKRAGRPGR